MSNADGTSRSISYGAGSKTVTNERGRVTKYSYRAYGNPDQQFLMGIAAPEASASVDLSRNSKDLVTTASQGGFTRTYGYTSAGYLNTVTNPETGTTSYGRDAAGNMTSRSVGSSGTTTYSYDGQNRLKTVNYPGSTPSVSNNYNGTHKLTSSNSSAASHSYTYDGNDNLRSETVTVDGYAFTVSYGVTSTDQLSSITYPRSGRVVSYSPDALGRPSQVSGYASNVSYWPSGQVKQITLVNGEVDTYDQNNRLWPSQFSNKNSASSLRINSIYNYDGVGNVTSISDSVDASYTRTLGYDGIDRVISANGPWGAGSVSYNGVGNITGQVFGGYGLSYAYGISNNRLSSVSGSKSSSFDYDAYGDITGAYGKIFTYDGVPNLRCANCNDATTRADYNYDATNQRVSVTKAGVKTYEIYGLGGHLLAEFTPSLSNRLVEYIYLGGKRIAQVEPAAASSVTPGGGGGAITAIGGRAFTLTATVKGSSPTGTVKFYDGATLLGSAPLINGTASLITTITKPGAHTITIEYSGDAANAPSTSTVTVTVSIPPELLVPMLLQLLD